MAVHRLVLPLILVTLLSLSGAMLLPASGDGSNVRGPNYAVSLISDEKEPNTGNLLPLEHSTEPGSRTTYKVRIWNLGLLPDTYNLHASGVPNGWSAVCQVPQVTLNGNTSTTFLFNVTPPYQGMSPDQVFQIPVMAVSLTDPTNVTASIMTKTKTLVKTGFSMNVSITKDNLETDIANLENKISLSPDESKTFAVDVRNLANVNDTFLVNVTQTAGWDVIFSNYLNDVTVFAPSAKLSDKAQRNMLYIRAPSGVDKGEQNIITITCRSDYNVANSITPLFSQVVITATVDFVSYVWISTQQDTYEMSPNETVDLDIQVTNVGEIEVNYQTPINTFADNGGRWLITSTQTKKLLSPGDAFTFKMSITSPVAAPSGITQEFVVTGRTSDEAVFIPATIICSVKQVHELLVTTDPATIEMGSGGDSEFVMDVTNLGNGPESLDIMVADGPAGWTVEMDTTHIFLDPGKERSMALKLLNKDGTPLGDYNITIRFFDPLQGLSVRDFDLNVTVADYPDLSVNSTDIVLSNTAPKSKEEVTISVTVHNLGRLNATNVKVRVVQVTGAGSRPLISEYYVDVPAHGQVQRNLTWSASPAAESIEVEIDPTKEVKEVSEMNNLASAPLFVTDATGTTTHNTKNEPLRAYQVASLITLTAVFTIFIVLLILKIGGKKLTFLGLGVPMYSKVRDNDMLQNETREEIYDYILEHPGTNFRSMLTELALSNGTLSHHLNTLERAEYIKSERDGSLRRYYPQGRKLVGEVYELNTAQQRIMETVALNPGISQKDIAKNVGISPPTAHYHLTALRNSRLIEMHRDGKVQRCYIVRRTS